MIDIEKLKVDLVNSDAPRTKVRQTKIGIFRELYPLICTKLNNGWKHADVTEWLQSQGVEMSVRHFRVCLNEVDSEHGYVRSGIKAKGLPARASAAQSKDSKTASQPTGSPVPPSTKPLTIPGKDKPPAQAVTDGLTEIEAAKRKAKQVDPDDYV